MAFSFWWSATILKIFMSPLRIGSLKQKTILSSRKFQGILDLCIRTRGQRPIYVFFLILHYPNQLSQQHLLKICISPLNFLGSLVKNHLPIKWQLISGLAILICWSIFECFKFLFFFKIVLAIWVPLQFHINFRISLSISTKKLPGILIGSVFQL